MSQKFWSLVFLALFVAYVFGYMLPSIFVDFKQIAFVREKLYEDAVILHGSNYKRAGFYALESLNLSIFLAFYRFILFGFWVVFGFVWLQKFISLNLDLHIQSALFIICFLISNQILLLPVNFYKKVYLDRKFGFGNVSIWLFIQDKIKTASIFFVTGFICGYALSFLALNFSFWWIYVSIFCAVILICINMIYPCIIAPYFNKKSPLKNRHLNNRINNLIKNIGSSASGIYTMDTGRKDGLLNAYFGGIFSQKRIILFEALLNSKISNDGILAIIGHELGHLKYKDLLKKTLVLSFIAFSLFLAMDILVPHVLYGIYLDLYMGQILAFVMLLSSAIIFWGRCFFGYFSRSYEYRADRFGASLTGNFYLADALLRIVHSEDFPHFHPIYTFFYHIHPPLLDRLRALGYEHQ